MKRTLVLVLTAALAVSLGMTGCGEKNSAKETFSSVLETKEKKDILVMRYSYPEPDYEYQLWLSDDVIFGEVVEELDGKYSNPDGAIEGLGNAWITPYAVKVEKSYKGVIKEGETIVVNAWNNTGVYPEDEETYTIQTNEREFYLHDGQRGIFMLAYSKVPADDNEQAYYVVMDNEGIFEAKDMGVSLTSENEDVIYASPSFEITLDQIAGDIQKADELYKDIDKNAPSEIFVNDDEVDAAAGQTNGITE